MEAVQALFRDAVVSGSAGWPCKVNLHGNTATHRALRLLREEQRRWRFAVVRSRQYLNNIVEQDHRAIKRRCASMLGFESFGTAAVTLAGIELCTELAHRIRKRQFSLGRAYRIRAASLKDLWDRALAL